MHLTQQHHPIPATARRTARSMFVELGLATSTETAVARHVKKNTLYKDLTFVGMSTLSNVDFYMATADCNCQCHRWVETKRFLKKIFKYNIS